MRGLGVLDAIVTRASERDVTRLETDELARRFAAGLAEVTGFLASAGSRVRMVQGVSASQVRRPQPWRATIQNT